MASSPAPDEPTRPQRGMRLGQYRLNRLLGAGGMGVVWLADDQLLKRQVAIKLLSAELAAKPGLVKRFLREAQAAARLNHPNVVTIHEVAIKDKVPYLVMEYLPGGSTHDLAAQRNGLPFDEATRLIIQAGKGLQAAHEVGLIHRDIKPGNLLLGADTTVKVADFGLVKIIDGSATANSSTSTVLGTPHYMSPEQCKSEALDERSDIYSLAATWYTLLTNRTLYQVEGTYGLLFAHCSEPAPDPRDIKPDLPERCLPVLGRALAKSRSARYPRVAAFIADLEKLLSPAAIETPPEPIKPPRQRFSRRLFLGGSMLALAGAVAVGAWIAWPTRDNRSSKEHPTGEQSNDRQLVEEARTAFLAANPGFDGKFVPLFEGDRIDALEITGNKVRDLNSVGKLKNLRRFHYSGQSWQKGELRTIEGLRGLNLRVLEVTHCQFKDLEPVRGMSLEEVDVMATGVSDLRPIVNPELWKLNVHSTLVTSLVALEQAPRLRWLNAGNWSVKDLTPLQKLPIEYLKLYGCTVSSLEPLAKCPLVYLDIRNNERLRDLSPLEKSSLQKLDCDKALAQRHAARWPRFSRLNTVNEEPIRRDGKE